jgi:hypothetical protein
MMDFGTEESGVMDSMKERSGPTGLEEVYV